MSRGLVGLIVLVFLALLGHAQAAVGAGRRGDKPVPTNLGPGSAPAHERAVQTGCKDETCGAFRKILAGRADGFAKLRGKALSGSVSSPDEYAGTVELPGAKSCTVEVVAVRVFYLCLFPPAPYAKLDEEYLRLANSVKQALPPGWVAWEVAFAPGKDDPGAQKTLRAGPRRGALALEIGLAVHGKEPPSLKVLVYQGTVAERR